MGNKSSNNVFVQAFSIFKSKRVRNIFYLLLIVFATFAMLCIDKGNQIVRESLPFLSDNLISDILTSLGIERYNVTSSSWVLFGVIVTVAFVIVLGNVIAPGFVNKKVKENPDRFPTESKTRAWYSFLFYGVLVLIAVAILGIAAIFGAFDLYGSNNKESSPFISLIILLGVFIIVAFVIVFIVALIFFIIRLIVLACTGKLKKAEESPEEVAAEPVAETKAEEVSPAQEETAQAEPIAAEPVAEEPAPVQEEQPVEEQTEQAEEQTEEPVTTAQKEPIIVINNFPDGVEEEYVSRKSVQKSFAGKMAQATKEQKAYYNELKNYMLAFKRVNSRTSWNYDSFNIGRDKVVKIAFRGQTMVVFFALNPKDYKDSKYHPKDMGDQRKFADTPMMVKVKSERGVKFAKELMDEVCKDLGLKKNFVAENYEFPYMSDRKLIEKGLAKEVTVTLLATKN